MPLCQSVMRGLYRYDNIHFFRRLVTDTIQIRICLDESYYVDVQQITVNARIVVS